MTNAPAPAGPPAPGEAERLVRAERTGLKLAVLCRTVAIGLSALWWIGSGLLVGAEISPAAIGILSGLTVFGVAAYLSIGTRFDHWWLKFAIYTLDILAVCAVFAFVPLRTSSDVPQIIAFRAYGIYFLFPLIAMACLSLSWRLVLWCGFVAVAGWAAAYWSVIRAMPRRIEWRDFPANAGAADYEALFLSIDFAGTGNRIVEAGMLFAAAAILALAVYRARRVFFAQVRAEHDRENERAARERATSVLGKYVPEAVALRLVDDTAALAPQEVPGVILVADIAGFSNYAAGRPPTEVIARLNDFLGQAASCVSDHDGAVILFTGDGLLASFNTPIPLEDPQQAAFSAARSMVDIAQAAGFGLRVGLAFGPIAAGSVGSSDRQTFTVYGDTVNRAARLETMGKTLQAAIVLDAAMAGALNGEPLRPAGSHTLKGVPGTAELWTADYPAGPGQAPP
ncbi:MAG: adenylate/guanylate cyclase domain-containing protein [Roseibium sp.]|nr:adenylate/guanylate cyclase domain-containing protein [Roseibium sp.]